MRKIKLTMTAEYNAGMWIVVVSTVYETIIMDAIAQDEWLDAAITEALAAWSRLYAGRVTF